MIKSINLCPADPTTTFLSRDVKLRVDQKPKDLYEITDVELGRSVDGGGGGRWTD